MFARALYASHKSKQLRFREIQRYDRRHSWLAFRDRPGLVDHKRVDLLKPFQRLGVLDQYAGAPRPTPTMIDIGVAKPSAHGQAMISTDTAASRA